MENAQAFQAQRGRLAAMTHVAEAASTPSSLNGVIIRNDNGSQVLANQVRSFLIQLEAKQEFTHVATPEENSYIEAFHSILQRELIERFEFSSFYEAKQHLEKYMQW